MLLEVAAATICSAPVKQFQNSQIMHMEVMFMAQRWAEEDRRRGFIMNFERDENGRLIPVLRKIRNGTNQENH